MISYSPNLAKQMKLWTIWFFFVLEGKPKKKKVSSACIVVHKKKLWLY